MNWVFLPLLPLFLLLIHRILRFQSQRGSVKNKIRRNRDIANFSIFHAKSLHDRLRLRAGPNARLVTTFGIYNSFTTTDETRHAEFLHRAIHTIKSADKTAWCRVWTLANGTMDTLVSHLHNRGQHAVNVERTVRILCFDAVLELLFAHTRIQPFDIEHADHVTKLINVLWLKSKKESDELRSVDQKHTLNSLHKALRELVSGEEGQILAFIMPAYETLWRVVLLTYIHVAFRYIDTATTDLVHEVVEIVSRDSGVGAQLPPTVDNFAREALRLYPPTKRIYRASPLRTLAADVESMHHDVQIWGLDALEFRPSRFGALIQDQKDAYMPFGVGRNTCPAINGFGRKMISSLVVALITRLGTRESGARVWFGDDKLDIDMRAPLPTGRNDMGQWVILYCVLDYVESVALVIRFYALFPSTYEDLDSLDNDISWRQTFHIFGYDETLVTRRPGHYSQLADTKCKLRPPQFHVARIK
ncbi:Cytochrome P450 [Fusarium albosuccineum]|uniref:Cytochrome P450 n=1 Tax=Fusarium albosuccineum TaxID=1237068 RepID=A0A8H4L5W5_9HYPO|nr:Cytochrome P450 [Fusarium albosuccineum]